MKILIIDNYDSFTFNLYQSVGEILKDLGHAFGIDVVRNDEITIEEIRKRKYDRIVISPGPGSPEDPAYFGVCADILTKIGKTIPVLGVCLGMQGMAHYFGGRVKRALKPMHGKTSIIAHDGKGVFQGLPQGLEVMRYHSLVADRASLPKVLEVTASVYSSSEAKPSREDSGQARMTKGARQARIINDMEQGEIMGLRHKIYPIEGIQFHPESFATEAGKQMLENFLFNFTFQFCALRLSPWIQNNC